MVVADAAQPVRRAGGEPVGLVLAGEARRNAKVMSLSMSRNNPTAPGHVSRCARSWLASATRA